MQRKIYESPGEERRDFWLGFIGWFVLNIGMAVLGVVGSFALVPLMSDMVFEDATTLMNTLSVVTSCLPLLINLVLLVFFAFTRAQVAFGMLAAFGVSLLITICLGVIATAACFVLLSGYQ